MPGRSPPPGWARPAARSRRCAIRTLRAGDRSEPRRVRRHRVADLLAAHRSLGGVGRADDDGGAARRSTAAAGRGAAARAPGGAEQRPQARPGRAGADRAGLRVGQNGRVRLTVSNPLADDAAHRRSPRSGGGHGLDGMRERFAALPLGGRRAAGVEGDRFVVDGRGGARRERGRIGTPSRASGSWSPTTRRSSATVS